MRNRKIKVEIDYKKLTSDLLEEYIEFIDLKKVSAELFTDDFFSIFPSKKKDVLSILHLLDVVSLKKNYNNLLEAPQFEQNKETNNWCHLLDKTQENGEEVLFKPCKKEDGLYDLGDKVHPGDIISFNSYIFRFNYVKSRFLYVLENNNSELKGVVVSTELRVRKVKKTQMNKTFLSLIQNKH